MRPMVVLRLKVQTYTQLISSPIADCAQTKLKLVAFLWLSVQIFNIYSITEEQKNLRECIRQDALDEYASKV